MKNIFEQNVTNEVISRISNINENITPLWGKMSAAQMLAHANVQFELAYENKYPKPKGFQKYMLLWLVKPIVVGIKPFKKNSPTSPQFKIKDEKNFENEKDRLIKYLHKTQELGVNYFDNKESHSFGKLSADEWNIMFYKHIDHHLQQFAV